MSAEPADAYAQLVRQQAALDARIAADEDRQLRYEQEMSLLSMKIQMRADRMRNVMYLALNPNISADDFAQLSKDMLAPGL